jgi:hypothetical protein
MKRKSSKKKSKKKKAQEKNSNRFGYARQKKEPVPEHLIVNWQEFKKFFNELLIRYKSNIAPLKYLSRGLKDKAQAFVEEYNTQAALYDAVEKMIKSNFLNGRVRKYPFTASVYWLVECEHNFDRVLTGYFDNPPEQELTEQERRKKAEEERQQEAEERRRKNNEIDQQIREEQRRAREEAHANRATPEQLEEIFKNFKLPPLNNSKTH